MASEQYYLISSLSSLKFREEPPISQEEFLEECAKWLSADEMRQLERMRKGKEEGETLSSVEEKWHEFDTSFRKDLARAREARKTKEDRKLSLLAGKVIEQANPLEMEIFLEKIRWDFLDSLGEGHFFDIGRLMIYYMQLTILERLAKFDKDKGEMYFNGICEVKYDYAAR